MTWERIQEPYLYGFRAKLNSYTLEAVRCYTGNWQAFVYKNGNHVNLDIGKFTSYKQAQAAARRWAEGKE